MIDETKLIAKLENRIDIFLKSHPKETNSPAIETVKEFIHMLENEALKQAKEYNTDIIMNNFLIIYKILYELERNMGNEEFDIQNICNKKLGITPEKWEQLLILMQDEGYVRGLDVSDLPEDRLRYLTDTSSAGITIKGIEYLAENSIMAKAKEILKYSEINYVDV